MSRSANLQHPLWLGQPLTGSPRTPAPATWTCAASVPALARYSRTRGRSGSPARTGTRMLCIGHVRVHRRHRASKPLVCSSCTALALEEVGERFDESVEGDGRHGCSRRASWAWARVRNGRVLGVRQDASAFRQPKRAGDRATKREEEEREGETNKGGQRVRWVCQLRQNCDGLPRSLVDAKACSTREEALPTTPTASPCADDGFPRFNRIAVRPRQRDAMQVEANEPATAKAEEIL